MHEKRHVKDSRFTHYVSRPSLFVEFAADERFQLIKGLRRILAVSMDGEFAAGSGGEHHQSHDALPVDLVAILLDEDFAIEAVGGLDEHSCGPGMDAKFVGN